MALTALDPHTGSVVFPFDNGCSKATCRDAECQASLVAVKESKFEEITTRRSHWRHQVKSQCRTSRRVAASKETPWHMNWKWQSCDAERVEYRHALQRGPDRVSVRTADVWTKFHWALEFQHSAIGQLDVRRRENHYKGKVVWIVDCTHGDNGAFDIDGPHLRWHAAPEWVRHTRALVAIDDGDHVHLLPPNFSQQLSTSRERILRQSVVTYEHAAWVELWINGDVHPLGTDFASTWTLEKRERAKDKERNQSMDSMIEASFRRARYGSASCSFRGDRTKLVFIQNKLFEITICQIETCNSAASFDGTCYAHTMPTEETR